MTVIAYKDGILVSDHQATNNDHKYKVKKIFRHGDEVIALTGDFPRGMQMLEWYRGKRDQPMPPACDNMWSNMIVFKGKKIYEYQNVGTPIISAAGRPRAWGSGRDYALGAMDVGATAIEAVRAASRLSSSCGYGYSSFKVF